MKSEFVILKLSWLTDRYRSEEDKQDFIGMHFYLAKFLQDNGLSLVKLVNNIEDIDSNYDKTGLVPKGNQGSFTPNISPWRKY